MPRAGDLKDRYTLQQRQTSALVGGLNKPGGWSVGFTVWAQTQFLHGTEAVQSARLQGVQPVIITVRASSQTRPIDNTWQAVDARDPSRVFNITGAEISPDRAWVQLLAVTKKGQANGG